MLTQNLGYPRIGNHRELKKACESYWTGQLASHQLEQTAKAIRAANWQVQKDAGIEWIPCNDFALYDHVLDTCIMVGAIPERYYPLLEKKPYNRLDLLFAMARGYQQDDHDITAMEMTKWFDTNYHYIVPEFKAAQKFTLFDHKVIHEYNEAKQAGFNAKPVLLGPVSFLLLGKEKEENFSRLELISSLLPVYIEMLKKLDQSGAYYVQIDEPCLALNLSAAEQQVFIKAYQTIQIQVPQLKIILTSYFDSYGDNLPTVLKLPVHTIHLDLVRNPDQLNEILNAEQFVRSGKSLSLGIVDGRNIWKNDFQQSLELIQTAIKTIGSDRLWIAPSCSLLHVPCDLELEANEKVLTPEIKQWMAFAKQKLNEVVTLKRLSEQDDDPFLQKVLQENIQAHQNRRTSTLIHNPKVSQRLAAITDSDAQRKNVFAIRQPKQRATLQLPLYPTTTIGSFPQTKEVRSWRAKWKKGAISDNEYEELLKTETGKAVQVQEEIGLDVLVHGEFERNDMVEYFGEQLSGFVFTQNGWVQSYGSRCVKPPIIYGDVERPQPMTVQWSAYAQSLTEKPMKGMLTGPVTILQWSFVRNDQPRSVTCTQIALAIRDEVSDLEKAGIKIIQIDEPAIREGLPLKKAQWDEYLQWAVKAFRIAASNVEDETQIHTHMCYSEFNDIIEHIAAMDADVITIETSRSQMELLEAFVAFQYPNEIGPGVYDIHSPRVPDKTEMITLLEKAATLIPAGLLWVNPDCGLKTRGWKETIAALKEMVSAAQTLRESVPMQG